jgi:hypothetical protein
LSWQVVPDGLPALLGGSGSERAERAMQAMLTMKNLAIRAMERAAGPERSYVRTTLLSVSEAQ